MRFSSLAWFSTCINLSTSTAKSRPQTTRPSCPRCRIYEIRGDERAQKACELVAPATDEDFATEYLDYIISVKTVDTIDEAIAHINANSTGHSEAIITENKENAEKFLKCIDSSSVYVNASTRFTDGGEFGLGAEIGISTQKLHARGPMGLEQLTSTKYLIYGDGQVR